MAFSIDDGQYLYGAVYFYVAKDRMVLDLILGLLKMTYCFTPCAGGLLDTEVGKLHSIYGLL